MQSMRTTKTRASTQTRFAPDADTRIEFFTDLRAIGSGLFPVIGTHRTTSRPALTMHLPSRRIWRFWQGIGSGWILLLICVNANLAPRRCYPHSCRKTARAAVNLS